MIVSKLKSCCYECNSPDIKTDHNGGVYYNINHDFHYELIDCTISCSHQYVCKKYLESEEEI